MNKTYGISNFHSFLLALALYIFIVVLVFFRIVSYKEPVVKYTDLEESFIDINLAQSNFQAKSVKNINKTPSKEMDIQKLFEETTPKASKVDDMKQKASDFNALFGNVKEIQEEKDTKIQSSAQSFEQDSRSQKKASQIVQKLNDNLITQELGNMNDTFQKQRTGVYDEFLGALTRIIQERWSLYYPNPRKIIVVVKIFIDSEGRFGFTSIQKSYDEAFDAKVLEFLQNQTGKFIINPPKGEKIDITMNLGDEIQGIE